MKHLERLRDDLVTLLTNAPLDGSRGLGPRLVDEMLDSCGLIGRLDEYEDEIRRLRQRNRKLHEELKRSREMISHLNDEIDALQR